MSRYESEGWTIFLGSEVALSVTEYNGRVGFAPMFCRYDDEVMRHRRPRSISVEEELEYGYDDYDFDWPRSVRFFNPASSEPQPQLQVGEVWTGKITDFNVSDKTTKDRRVMVFITLSDLRRQTKISKIIEGDHLAEKVTSGSVLVSVKLSKLTKQKLRFRYKDVMVEFEALVDSDGRPIKRIGPAKSQNRQSFFKGEERDLGKIWRALSLQDIQKLWEGIPFISWEDFSRYTAFSPDFFNEEVREKVSA